MSEVCRKMGVSEQTLYGWRKKFQVVGVAEMRRLRALEEKPKPRQSARSSLQIIEEMGIEPLPRTTTDLPVEVFSQHYEWGSTMVTTNLPFDEWTEVFESERLTGALLDRLTHHVHILEMNVDSYRLKGGQENAASQSPDCPEDV